MSINYYSIKKIFNSKNKNFIVLSARYFYWQIIKMFALFPKVIKFSNSKVLIRNITEANEGGGLIFVYDLYDYNNMSFLKLYNELTREVVFFDVGANRGIYSLLLSENDSNTTYSFEPHPKTYSLLEYNIAFNNRRNIYPFNFAIGSEISKIRFTDVPYSSTNHVLDVDTHETCIEVQLTTLDEFCIIRGIQPNILKIDVEGFEYNVLLGSDKILNKVDIILCEISHNFEKICTYLTFKDFYGPYKIDFRNKKLVCENNISEDFCFINKLSIKNILAKLNFEIKT
jgi:FkbM family methyltransferase